MHALLRRQLNRLGVDAERLIVGERMASMGRMVASVAHEINNPLSFVYANLENLDELLAASMTPELDEVLSDTRMGIERIRVIVRDLRGLSRADEDHRAPISVERVMESALQMAMNEIRHRACLVRAYTETPLVSANETRLAQVFLNLLMNAAEALPDGRASENSITIATRTEDGGFVRVEVTDTGGGVAPEHAERIFDPFFTTKAIGAGTGLGLAISRGIVESSGGSIHVEHPAAGGATFVVRLPIAATTRSARPRAMPPSSPTSLRVLVVDDEDGIRRAIVRALSEHEVHATSSARQAIRLIDAGERFDVILCDLMMPDLTGMDFHALLGSKAPELLSRLVFISGGAFTPSTSEFLRRVTSPKLEKPFTNSELRALVAKVGASCEGARTS